MNSKFHPRSSTHHPRPFIGAFTLIELLVVIAVIAILAAMLFAVMPAVGNAKAKSVARSELTQIMTGIEAFKARYGSYPRDNPVNKASTTLGLELMGTLYTNSTYRTLDGFTVTPATLSSTCGVDGLVNSSTSLQASDEQTPMTSFLKDVKPAQLITNGSVRMLACSVDSLVWYYNSTNPTNNPGTYDLWVDLLLSGKTVRIGNWNK